MPVQISEQLFIKKGSEKFELIVVMRPLKKQLNVPLCAECNISLSLSKSRFQFECPQCGIAYPAEKVGGFSRRDELLKIKEDNIKENILRYIERQTGERSVPAFFFQGLITSVFSGVPTITGAILRNFAYRAILGRISSQCFIEKNVRLNAPQRIFMGERVVIGEGSTLNAGVMEKGKACSRITIGKSARIPRYCVLKAGPGDIYIGNFTGMGQFCWLDGSGGLEIGDYTQIASHVVIITNDREYLDNSIYISFQKKTYKKVTIGKDVWIGTHAVILPGVTLGKGCVIGAGAVVTKDVPEYSVALGVPAEVKKQRA